MTLMKHRPAKDSYHLLDRQEQVFDKRHIHDTHKTHSIGLMHICIQCSSCPHHCNYHVAQNKKLKTYIVQWCKSTKQKNKKQEMFVKHNAPLSYFCHSCFVQLDWSVQNKFHKINVWRRNSFWEIVTSTIGNGFGTFEPNDVHLWPSNPKIISISLLPKTNVWTKFEEGRLRRSEVDQKQFWHICRNWPWPSNPKINRVPMLPRTDVWTKFEEGR